METWEFCRFFEGVLDLRWAERQGRHRRVEGVFELLEHTYLYTLEALDMCFLSVLFKDIFNFEKWKKKSERT